MTEPVKPLDYPDPDAPVVETWTDPDVEALRLLRKPFPPEQIGKLPKGGTFLDYVGHADITARLLDVDPYWTWEPFAVDGNGLPAIHQGNLWIRLTVCGVTRIGVGDGKSAKEMIGDAIRNAAMRFGAALDLWAKGDRDYARHEQVAEAMRPEWYTKTIDLIAALSPDDKGRLRDWCEQESLPLNPAEWSEESAKQIRQRAHIIGKR